MKYNWNKTTPTYEFLEKVQKNTYSQIDPKYSSLAAEFSQNLEEFIKQCVNNKFIDYYNIRQAIMSLDKHVNSINVLPAENRGIYGTVSNNVVLVNPDLNAYKRRLYQFHELAHTLVNTSINFRMLSQYNNSRHQRGLSPLVASPIQGRDLLEDAIVQNIAEECFYSSIDQPRPQQTYKTDPKVLGNKNFRTNFDYYGLYQPLATRFARTLRGIGKSKTDSDDYILNEFCRRACHENIFLTAQQEYKRDGVEDGLYETLSNLGLIRIEQLATFGYASKALTIPETIQVWDATMSKMKQLEDYRPLHYSGPGGDNR